MSIHEHSEFKLGLKPHDKPDDQLLRVRWSLGQIPQFPAEVDNMAGVTLGLDRNDELGDCGPTSGDNHRRIKSKIETGTQVDAALADVLELYAASTTPPFDPVTGANDNGVTMPDLMNAMRKVGLGGEKIVAFGRLQDMSNESIMAAIYIFKAVIFAVDLKVAQQGQTQQDPPKWDWVNNSGEWGGHAIVAAAYRHLTGEVDVGSWARRVITTENFRKYQLMEVWVPIYQSTIDDQNDAVDWGTMAQDFANLTDGTLPPPTNPTPTPAPTPIPNGDAPFPGASAEVARHILASAARAHMSIEDWMNHHFGTYFEL
jgi:hypothetical protein